MLRQEFENKFNMEDVRKFWNSVAEKYDSENKGFSYTHTQRFNESIKHMDLKQGMKLLNIWSRTGEAIPYLRRKFKNIEITNLEISDSMVKISKQRFPNEKFINSSLHKFPLKDKTFDCVLSLETLEHVPKPLLFLKETHRVLKPGKKLIMSLPPATAEYTSIIADAFRIGHGEGPHKFLPSKKVKQMLNITGFKLLLHKGTVLVPVGPKFLKKAGFKIENHIQNSFIKEFGIRQFYICEKV